MARSYRPVVRDQAFLLPPDMRGWLPADHLVWFVLEIVDRLDRSAFHARHRNVGVGRAAYDPDMLLGLLIYAYCNGVRSSRQIERLCWSDVAFRVLCAQDVPDHATIARFRAGCQEAFAGLWRDRRTRYRQPEEDHRPVLPPRPRRRGQRTPPGRRSLQPPQDPPGRPHLTSGRPAPPAIVNHRVHRGRPFRDRLHSPGRG